MSGDGATATAERATPILRLEPLTKEVWTIPIIGITPVIPHKWSEKALRMMREAQGIGGQGRARKKLDPKSPEEEAEASTYRLADGRPGIPATAFKAAIADACRFFQGITMEDGKRAVYVRGELDADGETPLVAIEGVPTMREDTPRNSGRGRNADLRYRFSWFPWRAELDVEIIAELIDRASLVSLVDASGLNGVGDWRPSSPQSKTGVFGKYEIDRGREITGAVVEVPGT